MRSEMKGRGEKRKAIEEIEAFSKTVVMQSSM